MSSSPSGTTLGTWAASERSFVASLDSGRLRWDLLTPFPEEDPEQRRLADRHVAEFGAFVEAHIDPELVDETLSLPTGFVEELRARGYLALRHGPEVGGLGLSTYGALRVIDRAVTWSSAVGQLIGVQNGVSPLELARFLPAGSVRELLEERIADRTVAGWADTELTGQNNSLPKLTGTLTDDGSAYLLRGQKAFIGNGPIAELIAVTGLVVEAGNPRICVFFADARQPGLSVHPHEFMGSKGLPVGELTFADVRVPKEHVLPIGDGATNPQADKQTRAMGIVGRTYSTSAIGLPIARLCLRWSREFVSRRFIDGQNLGEYDLVQRILVTSLADTFAAESVLQWALIGPGVPDRWFESVFAMNSSRAAIWRVVDQTLSLLGGEGLETARSKRRRGASPLPLERYVRDARAIRTIGNVDFQVDNLTARQFLARYYDAAGGVAEPDHTDLAPRTAREADLSPSNTGHLHALAEQVRAFSEACRQIVRRYPDPRELAAAEQTLVLVCRIASELFTASVVLARASHLASSDAGASQALADVYCTEARHRLADLWRRFAIESEPDYAKISRDWLAEGRFDALTSS